MQLALSGAQEKQNHNSECVCNLSGAHVVRARDQTRVWRILAVCVIEPRECVCVRDDLLSAMRDLCVCVRD